MLWYAWFCTFLGKILFRISCFVINLILCASYPNTGPFMCFTDTDINIHSFLVVWAYSFLLRLHSWCRFYTNTTAKITLFFSFLMCSRLFMTEESKIQKLFMLPLVASCNEFHFKLLLLKVLKGHLYMFDPVLMCSFTSLWHTNRGKLNALSLHFNQNNRFLGFDGGLIMFCSSTVTQF